MFSKALRTRVIDGRVFVDLEQLVELIFDVSTQTSLVATNTSDPALGIMTLGVSHLGQALEGTLTLQKQAHGLGVQPTDSSGSQSDTGSVAEQS
jgi:hypothetical protein